MSIKIKQLLLVSGLGLSVAVAIGGIQYVMSSSSRKPASMLEAPKNPVQPWADSLQGKMQQAISVQLSTIGGVPDNENQEMHLRAEITLNRAINSDLEYQWELPDGVSIVSGYPADGFANVKPGQTVPIDLYVVGFAKTGNLKTITLHASGFTTDQKFQSSGSFANNSAVQMAEAEKETATGQEKLTEESAELVLKKEAGQEKLNKVQE